MLTTWWSWVHSPRPPGAQGQIMFIPVTPPCSLTIIQSENCVQADHRPWDPPSLTWLLKVLCWNPSESFRGFLVGHEPPASLHGLTMNLSLLQTPMFQFVWLHYALGTWTCKLVLTKQIPKVMVVGRGAFGRWLGRKGGVFMNGISALARGFFYLIRTQWEDSCLWMRKWALTSHWISQFLDHGLPSL